MRTWQKLAAAVAAITLLGGCTNNQGVAARVDGRTIPVSVVDEARTELGPILQSGSPGAVLSTYIIGPVFVDAAEGIGVAVSDDEAISFLKTAASNNGVELGELSPSAIEFGRINLTVNKLIGLPDVGQILAEVATRIQELDVEVNPRYGTYDPATGYVTDADPAWIVSG